VAGANPALKDLAGENAIDWARKYNRPAILKAFRLEPLPVNHAPHLDLTAYAQPSVRDAVSQSTHLLQKTTQGCLKEGGCVAGRVGTWIGKRAWTGPPTGSRMPHPVTAEDRVMQLMGLHWANTPDVGGKDRLHDLLALQSSDGGWSRTAFPKAMPM
jgi:hypothetical protein